MEYIKYKLLQSYLNTQTSTLTPGAFDKTSDYFHFIIGTSDEVSAGKSADVIISATESISDYKNYFYCIGTVIGTSTTENVTGVWQQFNKPIVISIGSGHRTNVYMVGLNSEAGYNNEESLNFTVIGSTDITTLKNNIHKCVSVAGHYGSLYYGTNYSLYGDASSGLAPATFKETKIGSCSDLKLFNVVDGFHHQDPYVGLFEDSYITQGPTFGTYVEGEIPLGKQNIAILKQQTHGRDMFQGCSKLTYVNIPLIFVESDTGHNTSNDGWQIDYFSTYNIGGIFNYWNYRGTSYYSDYQMFAGCTNLETIEVDMFNSLNHLPNSTMVYTNALLGTCIDAIYENIANDTGLSVGSTKKFNLKNAAPLNTNIAGMKLLYDDLKSKLSAKGWTLYINGSKYA